MRELNVIRLLLRGRWMPPRTPWPGLGRFILIITIPFGIAVFRIAATWLWPFGRTTESAGTPGVASLSATSCWIFLRLGAAVGHLVTGGSCLTIIGIPLGLASSTISPSRWCRWGSTSSRPRREVSQKRPEVLLGVPAVGQARALLEDVPGTGISGQRPGHRRRDPVQRQHDQAPTARVLRGVPRLMPQQPRAAGELGVAELVTRTLPRQNADGAGTGSR